MAGLWQASAHAVLLSDYGQRYAAKVQLVSTDRIRKMAKDSPIYCNSLCGPRSTAAPSSAIPRC